MIHAANASARQCQCCDRTALWGTPEHDRAVDPNNCPRCDHFYAVALAGGPADFRGVDSPLFVAAPLFAAPALVLPPPPARKARRPRVTPFVPGAQLPSRDRRPEVLPPVIDALAMDPEWAVFCDERAEECIAHQESRA